MSDQNEIISYFRNQASAASDAARLAAKLAVGGNLSNIIAQKRPTLVSDTRSRVISLELLQTSYQQSASQQTQVTNGSNGSTVASMITRKNVGNPQISTIAAINLDVTPVADGWAQRISLNMPSRQSEQQTALGFHIFEWGYGIGTLDVDCLVSLGSDPSQAIKPFFDLLYKAKTTRPLANEFPKVLRYTDSYLGKTLIISQKECRLEESVDTQNLARLVIRAAVLRDYDNPVTVLTSAIADQSVVVSGIDTPGATDVSSLLNFG